MGIVLNWATLITTVNHFQSNLTDRKKEMFPLKTKTKHRIRYITAGTKVFNKAMFREIVLSLLGNI